MLAVAAVGCMTTFRDYSQSWQWIYGKSPAFTVSVDIQGNKVRPVFIFLITHCHQRTFPSTAICVSGEQRNDSCYRRRAGL